MNKVLIIGYGSIGKRHASIVSQDLACEVAIVSKRKINEFCCYHSVREAFEKQAFTYVIVANSTSEHCTTLEEIQNCGYKGIILVEKPISKSGAQIKGDIECSNVYVGYNLRFHPIIQQLSNLLANKKIISAQIYCGQYLPTWRPERDYRKSYSSSKQAGGGVLRDLSHELDYLQWLFGTWQQVFAYGGHFSSLEIDSDDSYAVLLRTEKVPMITVQVNYLDRICQREIIINTNTDTIKADLVNSTICVNNNEINKVPTMRNESYKNMHESLLNGTRKDVCKWMEGVETMRLIDAIECSILKNQCINRK